MIALLTGEVTHVALDSAVVVVGGCGFRVFATPATLATLRIGRAATLYTSLVVREDSLTLFGFAEPDERELFDTVQTVSGVGPRLALAITAVLSPDEVARAVADDDHATLARVPGVGKKSAQRLALELKGKLVCGDAAPGPANTSRPSADVVSALVGLGYQTKAAEDAVAAVPPDVTGDAEVLRAALRHLAGV